MSDKNLMQRLIVIGIITVVSLLFLFPPGNNFQLALRPGLDIAGGVSMIFEIDDTGLETQSNLAENVKTLLQKRVDPKGVYNLVWRVHGRNRLEVQMPLPPADAARRRDEYNAVRDALFEANIKRGDLEQTLRLAAGEREPAIAKLSGGSEERKKLVETAAMRYDAYLAAAQAKERGPASQPIDPATGQPSTAPASGPSARDLELAARDATESLEDAIDGVLASNLDPRRFDDILELDTRSSIRQTSLDEIKKSHPALKEKIETVVAKYAEWKAYRSFLDGPADLRRLLRGAGVLEFRMLADPSPENATRYDALREKLHKQGPRPSRGDNEGWFRIDNPGGFLAIDSAAQLAALSKNPKEARFRGIVDFYNGDWFVLAKLGESDGLLSTNQKKWRLKYAYPNRDEHGRPCVAFELDANGGLLFGELTRNNIEKQLCIFVDNVAYSSANILSEIRTNGQIMGDFSAEKINYLVNTMQAGALPARLKDTPLSERTIGSSLGDANLRQALTAGLIAAAAVILIMLFYYALCGAIANIAMMMNLLLVLAAMAMLGARMTLDGIAGVILGLGMAVDANVLIYERMREEKERGASLRMIIKNGYDKAFSTIFDSNVTTLLTSLIIYYVGSEEVKGFGLTLGWGVVMNLFTAVFVTRTLFTLLVKYNVIKGIKMMKLIGVPNIDWYSHRKIFVPLSLTVTLGGLVLMAMRSPRDYLDVEFLGGISADIELKAPTGTAAPLDEKAIRDKVAAVGQSITEDAKKLAAANVEPIAGDAHALRVNVPGVPAARLAALLAEPMDEHKLVQRGGVSAREGGEQIVVHFNEGVTPDGLRDFVRGRSAEAALSGENIARANLGSVSEAGADAKNRGRIWNITTTETNKLLVQNALVTAIGDRLQIRPQVNYVVRGDEGRPFPITDRRLEAVVPGLPPGAGTDISNYLDGAAIYFDELDPPQAVDPKVTGSFADRLKNMRLQPGYQDYPWRNFQVIGGKPAGKDVDGNQLYSSAVIVVVDSAYPYSDDPERWATEFAQKELSLAKATLDTEQSLRKVTQFKPQVATQAKVQATLALILSWAMIIAYVWIRFGRAAYGFAGVAALIHDVLVALAFVAISGWIGSASNPLLIEDFKINMTIIAALLTIIGFSINDTIVIFDRIRETRGRLGVVTPQIINDSLNQTLSRTLLTSFTVFVTLLVMYIFGGSSIRGFNYCMLIGVITGCYSSIAIAAPLLLVRFGRGQPANA